MYAGVQVADAVGAAVAAVVHHYVACARVPGAVPWQDGRDVRVGGQVVPPPIHVACMCQFAWVTAGTGRRSPWHT